jgi:hypothetical protein
VSDIFREVEEDVRRERIEKLWKVYGDYAIAAFAVLILAIAGWQFWKSYHGKEIMRASDAYSAAQLKASTGDPAGAAADFGKLAKEAPGGYATLSRLEQANALIGSGNTGDAITIYKEIEKDGDSSLSSIARLRHAWAIVDVAPKKEVTDLLAPLADPASDWQYSAREVLAYSDYHNGDAAGALAAFKKLADDTRAPENLRQRAQAMQGFLQSGGGRDIGAVPPPEPKPAAPTAATTPAPATAPAQNNGTPKP